MTIIKIITLFFSNCQGLITEVCDKILIQQQRMSILKKYSQVQSIYNDPVPMRKKISKSILDKYLIQDYPCLDAIERYLFTIIPYWTITMSRVTKNLANIIEGTWQFQYLNDAPPEIVPDRKVTASLIREITDQTLTGKNISIYLVFWLPITTMLISNFIHNQPDRKSNFDVIGAGLIMLGSMIVVSYGLYVYSNVLGSPFNMYAQHVCPSSFVAIVGFLYASLCAATPLIWLFPMTLVYFVLATYLHFRLYNNTYKPTLLEMVVLFLMLSFFYGCTAYLYYVNFAGFNNQKPISKAPAPTHFREFAHDNAQIF